MGKWNDKVAFINTFVCLVLKDHQRHLIVFRLMKMHLISFKHVRNPNKLTWLQ